eukprot:GHRR01006877.1.p1 GENE.GHRR01006877.1~~GHRR01006877.1.p1  ORF type:complete len:304 (+),score=128.73 GHRR01006877.1:354-1265(+)
MARRQEEEGIYDWGQLNPSTAGAPKVKTYNVPAPAAGPKAKMHSDSSQVEAVLNPVRGIRDAQARAGVTPTNHSRHNILAIKEQSRLNALQKLQEQDDAQVAKEQQFKPQLRRTASGNGGGRPDSSSLSRSGANSRPTGINRSISSNAASRRSSNSSNGSGPARDFVAENRAAAAAASKPVKAEARQEDGEAYLHKSAYGQVPAYLLERKMQLAKEHDAILAAKQAAQIPPGLRQMPDSERLSTLKVLEANRAEVEARLVQLPIIIETPSQIRHKDGLERRLHEIEAAQKIFSRPNVLVHAQQ